MKLQHIKKQLLTVALTTVAMGAMAQSLNSAYYTEDYTPIRDKKAISCM